MKLDEIVKRARKLCEPYRVTDGRRFRLKDSDPADIGSPEREDKPAAAEALRVGVEALAELRRIAGRCFSCSRPWTLREQTARSDT